MPLKDREVYKVLLFSFPISLIYLNYLNYLDLFPYVHPVIPNTTGSCFRYHIRWYHNFLVPLALPPYTLGTEHSWFVHIPWVLNIPGLFIYPGHRTFLVCSYTLGTGHSWFVHIPWVLDIPGLFIYPGYWTFLVCSYTLGTEHSWFVLGRYWFQSIHSVLVPVPFCIDLIYVIQSLHTTKTL